MNRRLGWLAGLLMIMLGGCTSDGRDPSWGFNVLQSRTIPYSDAAARESLQRLARRGADHVAVVVFMVQDSPQAAAPRSGTQVSDEQLVAALRAARKAGLETIVKPQLLVPGAWAGEIDPPDHKAWFAAYRAQLLHYARIARRERAAALVIGTELSRLEASREWEQLITEVRQVYQGKLTYAAHGIEGVRRFAHWQRLDAVGVSLYPSLGEVAEPGRIRERMEGALGELESATVGTGPVWLLEIGQPAAADSLARPWDWHYLEESGVRVDTGMQAMVLQTWVQTIRRHRNEAQIERVTLWNWIAEPAAGGYMDAGYTVQNKPAEAVLHCLWRQHCTGYGEAGQ